jgi:CheY-like chemotaxis protein
VLILDDERPIAELLGELLEIKGYDVMICDAGCYALSLLEQREFDLVISDLRMPEMSGQEFYALAIEKKPALRGKIIFISGGAMCAEAQAFLATTRSPYLTKPFRIAAVEKIIADTLHAPHSAERGHPVS